MITSQLSYFGVLAIVQWCNNHQKRCHGVDRNLNCYYEGWCNMRISIYKYTYKFYRKTELQKLDIIADWFNKYKKKDSLYNIDNPALHWEPPDQAWYLVLF